MSYFVRDCIVQMDRQQILDYNYKSDCDLWHDIWRYDRKHLDTDRHIVYLHKIYLENILNLSYILADNLVVHQYNLVDTNKLHGHRFHDKYWTVHTEMDGKDVEVRCVGLQYQRFVT